MRALPQVEQWAARAGWTTVPDEHEVRYYADLGRVERAETSDGSAWSLVERDRGPSVSPRLVVAALDRDDVARLQIVGFARTWLHGTLGVDVPFGRFTGPGPRLRLDRSGGGTAVRGPGGGIRATFGDGPYDVADAWSFLHYADLPVDELSARLERAGLRAAEEVRRGRRPGTLEREHGRLRRRRRIVIGPADG